MTGQGIQRVRHIFSQTDQFCDEKWSKSARVLPPAHAARTSKKSIIAHRRNHLRLRGARCGPCAGCQRYSARMARRVKSTAPEKERKICFVYYIDEKAERRRNACGKRVSVKNCLERWTILYDNLISCEFMPDKSITYRDLPRCYEQTR